MADPLTLEGFLERARRNLLREAPDTAVLPSYGDHKTDPSLVEFFAGKAPRAAAVLVPVIAHAEPTVLFTRRAETLSTHKGQIAFPGGRIDAGDGSVLDAALRETDEEIGLASRFVEPVGYLDIYQTGTGYRIAPVVGLVQPPLALTLNPAEVAAAFEVPLAFLMAAENHQRHSREVAGRTRHFTAMPYGEHFIWGATAGIVQNLHARIFGR